MPIQDHDSTLTPITETPVNLDVTTPNDISVKYLAVVACPNSSDRLYFYSPLSDDPILNDMYQNSISDAGNRATRMRVYARTNTSSQIRCVSDKPGGVMALYAIGWFDDVFDN